MALLGGSGRNRQRDRSDDAAGRENCKGDSTERDLGCLDEKWGNRTPGKTNSVCNPPDVYVLPFIAHPFEFGFPSKIPGTASLGLVVISSTSTFSIIHDYTRPAHRTDYLPTPIEYDERYIKINPFTYTVDMCNVG